MGRDLDAEAARAAGLVNASSRRKTLEPEILAAARALAALPREAVLASRRLLKGDRAKSLARIDAEAEIFAERLASREAQAAFAAFMQKRKIMSLSGKTLFITGASRGIGLAIALRAARDGANVAIAAKTTEPHPKLEGTIHTAADGDRGGRRQGAAARRRHPRRGGGEGRDRARRRRPSAASTSSSTTPRRSR